MSPAVCENRLPSTVFVLDGLGGGGDASSAAAAAAAAATDKWVAEQEAAIQKEAAEKKDGQFDIWVLIQASKNAAADAPSPYVHPLVRRSASSLSQKSLEVCTESLGSETGSDGVLSSDDMEDLSSWQTDEEEELVEKETTELSDHEAGKATHVAAAASEAALRRKEFTAVNYHCSVGRTSPPRSFPPPLPSLSRRDGPCLSMRRHRRDGRLVFEAVAVPSQNYLHARRHDGRLLLTLVETTFEDIYPHREEPAMEEDVHAVASGDETEVENRGSAEEEVEVEEEEEEEEGEGEGEEEEEVEVVDRGIVVEVKVSRPPPPLSGGLKVQRSSVVINKFVGVPSTNQNPSATDITVLSAPSRNTATTTTTATAVVAAAAAASSSRDADDRYWRQGSGRPMLPQRSPSPEKLFFISKRMMNRQDLLHQVRRCSEHLRPLFIWEPCCIATS